MRLVAVVAFRGRDSAGHYFTYRLHQSRLPPFPQRWVCANGGNVADIAIEDVLTGRRSVLLLNRDILEIGK
jgi:hypothetical protein